jgi:hypothetical protein
MTKLFKTLLMAGAVMASVVANAEEEPWVQQQQMPPFLAQEAA